MRKCKCGCGQSINHKHPNALFVSQKHKDKFWNQVNPRGKFVHLKDRSYDDRHPFDLEK